MSDEDYLEHFGLYYSQKIKVLAKAPFFTSCKGHSLTSKRVLLKQKMI